MTYAQESFFSRFRSSTLSSLRDVWPVWLTLSLLTTLPYVIARLHTPGGHIFSGVLSAYDDTFTYLAWIRQSADGHLRMCDLFTSEPQTCEFFLPLWSALGLITRVTGAPLPLSFHIGRVLAGLVLLLVARAVVLEVIKLRERVVFTLWLYAMSVGLGWIVVALTLPASSEAATGSADLNLPEAFAFRSVFAQVHFAAGAALVFGSVKLFNGALVERRLSRALWAGACVSILAVVHPYMLVVVFAINSVSLIAWSWLSRETIRIDVGRLLNIATAFAATAIPGV